MQLLGIHLRADVSHIWWWQHEKDLRPEKTGPESQLCPINYPGNLGQIQFTSWLPLYKTGFEVTLTSLVLVVKWITAVCMMSIFS